jgi:Zn-dependent protease with chaperone function
MMKATKLTFKRTIFLLHLFIAALNCVAQLQPLYSFQKDDSSLKKTYFEQTVSKKNRAVASVDKKYAADYKKIYEDQFKEIGKLWQSDRSVTAPGAHGYLQSIVQKIVSVNADLAKTDARVVFSRDWWPNAYSMGDGTIAINAGLMIFLHNEAELVFVVSHELAHYYLDHTNKSIKQYVEKVNSEEFQNELKRLSKEEYRVNKQLEELTRSFAFSSRRHSRDNEAAADRMAFRLMKKTGYDCGAITTCLELLDKVDDSLLYQSPDIRQAFNFTDYPFRNKWIRKESAIFAQLNEKDETSGNENDSLKTHPDCAKRIALLHDSIATAFPTGKNFLVNEELFKQLKKDFFIEMTEQCYRDNNLSRNLYYNLFLLQTGENTPLAVYSIARCLNDIYDSQKNHKLGSRIDTESKGYPEGYNLLLRMLNQIRLDEIASVNYHFCKQYETEMKNYAGFREEMNKAQNRKN